MKVIIAGSRHITDYDFVSNIIDESPFLITEIVSGEAKGVDSVGKRYGYLHRIPIKAVPAYWKRYGLEAGPIRNCKMAQYADALIAIPCVCSKGTRHMIAEARRLNRPSFIKATSCPICLRKIQESKYDRQLNVFATRLKRLRTSFNYTQKELAIRINYLDLNKNIISHLETGRKKPALKLLWELAEALDAPIDYLLGRSDQL